MVATSVPTWIPGDRGELLAWVHRPADGRSRATVVICPPLAREYDCSRASLRLLAEELVEEGFAAVRFDYYGTCDSDGLESDEALVDSWLSSIKSVVAFVRAAGEKRVVLVGLRMGATLAASVASALGGLEALGLARPWPPAPRPTRPARAQSKGSSSESETAVFCIA